MKLLLAAGGTGGHVFPVLALASELMKHRCELVWAGRPGSLESRVAAAHGINFAEVPSVGFVGKSPVAKMKFPLVMIRGVLRSAALLREERPDGLVAAGGYPSAAPLYAARLAGVSYFLLEQNSVPGRVTRMFAAKARECFLTFPVEGGLDGSCTVTGSPLRSGIALESRDEDGRTVLVLGGSGGARALSRAGIALAAACPEYRFIILTGRRDYDSIKTENRFDNCTLVEFTDHPEDLYRQATIVISRAGGMVLSELVANGIPAILIPFPFAADRHQHANAAQLSAAGAALLLDQDRLPELVDHVRGLMSDSARRARMAKAARAIAHTDAAAVIAERIETCLAG